MGIKKSSLTSQSSYSVNNIKLSVGFNNESKTILPSSLSLDSLGPLLLGLWCLD
nr:MAG TPA: hypothetical protein [Caudoviricetes sp.]